MSSLSQFLNGVQTVSESVVGDPVIIMSDLTEVTLGVKKFLKSGTIVSATKYPDFPIVNEEFDVWVTTGTILGAANTFTVCKDDNVMFMFAGSDNVYYTTTDGISFNRNVLTQVVLLKGIVKGLGMYLAISNAASNAATTAYATSTDGINWTARTLPVSLIWKKVAFFNGVFIALPTTGTVYYYSTDGINWTSQATPFTIATNTNIYNNETAFFLISGSTISVSTNGINWTSSIIDQLNSSALMHETSTTIYVVNNQKIYSTEDGITWTNIPAPDSLIVGAIMCADGVIFTYPLYSTNSENKLYCKVGNNDWKLTTTQSIEGATNNPTQFKKFLGQYIGNNQTYIWRTSRTIGTLNFTPNLYFRVE